MPRIQAFAPLWATTTCLALAACGGGSPSGEGPSVGADVPDASALPPPVNQPLFTNQPPEISGTPPESATVNSSWRFQPEANDADGDAMQFLVKNAPRWTRFDPATGLLAGTPGEGDLRIYDDILISVTDGPEIVSLPPFSIEVLPLGLPGGTATLSWTPPVERVDGSPIGDLAGYRVLYGRGSGQYDQSAEIDNPSITRYVIENLGPGNWFFAVTVRTEDGLESAPSAEVKKRIDGARRTPG